VYPVVRAEQHLRQQYAGAAGRAPAPPGRRPVRSVAWWRPGFTESTGPVRCRPRDRGSRSRSVGVAQVLHQGDRSDVQVARDQRVVQPVRGVLVQVHIGAARPERISPPSRSAGSSGTGCDRPGGRGVAHDRNATPSPGGCLSSRPASSAPVSSAGTAGRAACAAPLAGDGRAASVRRRPA